MSVEKIVASAIDNNPLKLKEAFEEEMNSRIRTALEEKYKKMMKKEEDEEEDQEDEEDEEELEESKGRAYQEGYQDGVSGKQRNPRASEIFGPEANEYESGYMSGKKARGSK